MLRGIACMLALAAPLFAELPSPEYTEALHEAEKLFSRGDMDRVLAKLDPWVTKYPAVAEGHHGMGLAYYQQKNFAAAIQHLSRALGLEKENSASWKQTVETLGMAYYFSNRASDALPLLEKAVGWASANSNLLYSLGMCYLYTHDSAHASRTFAELFQIPPNSAEALLLTADLMTQERYTDDAEALIMEARKKRPDSPETDYRLGIIALGRGDYTRAVQFLQRDLALNPSHSLGWHWLGDTYIRMGKHEEAIEPLQRAIWLNQRSARSYILLANVYVQQGRLLVAENALRRALELEPQNHEAHFLLGRVYYKTNRAELAKEEIALAEKLRGSADKD
jgi:tetratricopeptide (TPR) repeat protein